ncbi:hypothetical protein [Allosaccharopolyspora coralli]|nr:hypothetical protein [Allosaccharopolyspora coralli]
MHYSIAQAAPDGGFSVDRPEWNLILDMRDAERLDTTPMEKEVSA